MIVHNALYLVAQVGIYLNVLALLLFFLVVLVILGAATAVVVGAVARWRGDPPPTRLCFWMGSVAWLLGMFFLVGEILPLNDFLQNTFLLSLYAALVLLGIAALWTGKSSKSSRRALATYLVITLLAAVAGGREGYRRWQNEQLVEASRKGDADQVRSLLAKGYSANLHRSTGETLLMMAVDSGNLETLDALLEAGAEVNVVSRHSGIQTALSLAVRVGRADMVTRLLASGADVGAGIEEEPLSDKARRQGHLELVEILERAESR